MQQMMLQNISFYGRYKEQIKKIYRIKSRSRKFTVGSTWLLKMKKYSGNSTPGRMPVLPGWHYLAKTPIWLNTAFSRAMVLEQNSWPVGLAANAK
jgi:hypothetical protein